MTTTHIVTTTPYIKDMHQVTLSNQQEKLSEKFDLREKSQPFEMPNLEFLTKFDTFFWTFTENGDLNNGYVSDWSDRRRFTTLR